LEGVVTDPSTSLRGRGSTSLSFDSAQEPGSGTGIGNRDRELRDRELRDRELRDRELRDRELRDRELRDRELRGRELKGRELRAKTWLPIASNVITPAP